MKIKLIIFSILLSVNTYAITIGKIPKAVSISASDGGMAVDGSTWNSSGIKDKVMIMFYVDPDEKDTNSHFSKKLKEQNFDKTKVGSIAIINLAATWKPNFIIEAILKEKQKEFPNTIYVKDKKSVLVNEWSLHDDSSDILLFSKNGTLLFYKSGKMNDEDIKKVIQMIEDNI